MDPGGFGNAAADFSKNPVFRDRTRVPDRTPEMPRASQAIASGVEAGSFEPLEEAIWCKLSKLRCR